MPIHVQYPKGKRPVTGGGTGVGDFFKKLLTVKEKDRSGTTVGGVVALGEKGDRKSKNELCATAKDRNVPVEVAKEAVDQLAKLGCNNRILEVARTAVPELGKHALSKIGEKVNVLLSPLKRTILTSSLMAIALKGEVVATSIEAVNALKRLGDREKLELIAKKAKDRNVIDAATRALADL
ncbi:MAG: hypothetical protein ABIG39_07780 [Candidatus Micrarchaeota archaeon]